MSISQRVKIFEHIYFWPNQFTFLIRAIINLYIHLIVYKAYKFLVRPKVMRKQMMIVMMELVILILVEVKANNFAPTFAHRPSLPILLLHSSTYDWLQEYFVDCILHKFHNCQNKDNDRTFCSIFYMCV